MVSYNEKNPREYAGEIYRYDFDKKMYLSDVAENIQVADNFNKKLRMIAENRELLTRKTELEGE